MERATLNPEARKAYRTPPYVSFKSFMTLIDDLKANGLPPRIDRSVLKRFSGGLGSQLIVALKSLGLIEEGKNGPTEALSKLIKTHGTDEFKTVLQTVLDSSYPYLQSVDLKTATPSMFAEAFKTNTDAKEDVLRKCRTFFIHAAQYAGLPLGQRLVSGSGAPSTSGNGSARKKPKAATRQRSEEPMPAYQDTAVPAGDFATQLLTKFPSFDPSWNDDLKKAWFSDFAKFMTIAEAKNSK